MVDRPHSLHLQEPTISLSPFELYRNLTGWRSLRLRLFPTSLLWNPQRASCLVVELISLAKRLFISPYKARVKIQLVGEQTSDRHFSSSEQCFTKSRSSVGTHFELLGRRTNQDPMEGNQDPLEGKEDEGADGAKQDPLKGEEVNHEDPLEGKDSINKRADYVKLSEGQCEKNSHKPREHAAPPSSDVLTGPRAEPRVVRTQDPPCRHDKGVESPRSPKLSARARALLRKLPPSQFLLPDGQRGEAGFVPRRKGILDLYTGAAGVARASARRGQVWVLTFDIEHGGDQNLLLPQTQTLVKALICSGAFVGIGAAPECRSFSRAVRPPIRDRLHPEGILEATTAVKRKLAAGNIHSKFCHEVIQLAVRFDLAYWLENPDSGFLWLQAEWVAVASQPSSVHTGSISAPMELRGEKELGCSRTLIWLDCGNSAMDLVSISACQVGVLSIRSVGQDLLRYTQSHFVGGWPLLWSPVLVGPSQARRRRLDVAGCAKCSKSRIGEAAHPGPGRGPDLQRRSAVGDLDAVPLVKPATWRMQQKAWSSFNDWLAARLSCRAREDLQRCPSLLAEMLKAYGKYLFESGTSLHVYRMTLAAAQKEVLLLRGHMTAPWQLTTRWQEVEPVSHRVPIPEALIKAVIALAWLWNWRSFAGVTALCVYGIGRIGEVLKCLRSHLLLPMDLLDESSTALYLQLEKPKTARPGRGRIQHFKISDPRAMKLIIAAFSGKASSSRLFSLSPASYRKRWDTLLSSFNVPTSLHLTPGGLRGGGSVAAYRPGLPLSEIMWRMRLVSSSTLESYLQEVAAQSLLPRLDESVRRKVQSAARFFEVLFS